MYFTPSPLNPTDAMPELARRVGLILADLAGLVAARFLRRPHVAGLIVLLWHRLQRVAPRLARAMARPPVLCPGCPHTASYVARRGLDARVAGDIGCYSLAAIEPLRSIDTCVSMGSSACCIANARSCSTIPACRSG